jgi:hypothetical protein
VARWNKKKYVWFEGTPTEREKLRSLCRYPFHPYPKREVGTARGTVAK